MNKLEQQQKNEIERKSREGGATNAQMENERYGEIKIYETNI